jgi:hypothetical protein
VKNGVPFDVAFQMDEILRAAMAIKFAEFEGSKFNWHTMDFENPNRD